MKEILNKPLDLKDLRRIILLYHFNFTLENYHAYLNIENQKI